MGGDDMDAVRKLIEDRFAQLGLTMSKVSVEIGRNHAFLQQFLTRGIPRELHERDREQLAKFLGIPADDLRGPDNPRPPSHDNGADDRPQVQPAPEGTIRELITRRLGDMGLSTKDASLRIGRNETHVRQFLRGTLVELGERRETLGRLLEVSPDDLRGAWQTPGYRVVERALRTIIANPTKAAEIAQSALIMGKA
jgi:hypothetical protein